MEPFLHTHKKTGWIEVICGSMYSGKTEELLRRLKRAQIARQHVVIFKPEMDIRYDKKAVVSHDANSMIAMPVAKAEDLLLLSNGAEVVGIDEAQFFDNNLPDVAEQLAAMGIRVIAAGLDMDYAGRPFGPVPDMLARADYITKLHAICVQCGQIARYSYRFFPTDHTVLIGGKDQYEPRCRDCFKLSFS